MAVLAACALLCAAAGRLWAGGHNSGDAHGGGGGQGSSNQSNNEQTGASSSGANQNNSNQNNSNQNNGGANPNIANPNTWNQNSVNPNSGNPNGVGPAGGGQNNWNQNNGGPGNGGQNNGNPNGDNQNADDQNVETSALDAEMTLEDARDNFKTIVEAKIQRESTDGVWIYTNAAGRARRLRLTRVEAEKAVKVGGRRYAGPALLREARGKRTVRLRFVVDFTGDHWKVVDVSEAKASKAARPR